MSFKRVLQGGGFSKTEIAVLYGVSRQTVHTWAAGGSPRPGSYTERMAKVITTALVGAMDKRILPLGAMEREARSTRIKSMSRTLQGLKPAPITD